MILPIKASPNAAMLISGKVIHIASIKPFETALTITPTTQNTYAKIAPMIAKIIPKTQEIIDFFIFVSPKNRISHSA